MGCKNWKPQLVFLPMAARHQYYYSCALSLSPPFVYYMYYACKLVPISLCPTQQTPPFCFPCCDVCFPALKLLSLGTPDASQPEFTTNTWCSLIAAANCSAHTIALQQQCSFFSLFSSSGNCCGRWVRVLELWVSTFWWYQTRYSFFPAFLPQAAPLLVRTNLIIFIFM